MFKFLRNANDNKSILDLSSINKKIEAMKKENDDGNFIFNKDALERLPSEFCKCAGFEESITTGDGGMSPSSYKTAWTSDFSTNGTFKFNLNYLLENENIKTFQCNLFSKKELGGLFAQVEGREWRNIDDSGDLTNLFQDIVDCVELV